MLRRGPLSQRLGPVPDSKRKYLRNPPRSAHEHPAGIWKREFEIVSNFSSGIDPVGSLLAEHLEDDAAEMSAEGADGLVVGFTFRAFVFVLFLCDHYSFNRGYSEVFFVVR